MKEQSAMAFLSLCFDRRERVFLSVPHIQAGTIHCFRRNFMQSTMFKHALLKEYDHIHISSREYEE